jgi:hypothetical protein
MQFLSIPSYVEGAAFLLKSVGFPNLGKRDYDSATNSQ